MKCCVRGCSSQTGQGLCFGTLSKEQEKRKKWLKAIGKPDWNPENAIICEFHFPEEDFQVMQDGRRRIKASAVPVIGLNNDKKNKKLKIDVSASQAFNEVESSNTVKHNELYKLFAEYYKDREKKDFLDFFNNNKLPPLTLIRMEIPYDVESLKCHALENIKKQADSGMVVEPSVTVALCNFFNRSITSKRDQIYAAVFIHFSKSLQNQEDFNEDLETYLNNSTGEITEYNEIKAISKSSNDFLKEILKSEVIIKVFTKAITARFKKGITFTNEYLKEVIDKMVIYQCKVFPPAATLRGAALPDGILINKASLADYGLVNQTDKFKADMVTLAIHETCYYLALQIVKDFNFSTPKKIREEKEDTVNIAESEYLVELGRTAELFIFDSVQPLWSKSKPEAAKEFLSRLKTRKKLPLISEKDRESLKLKKRSKPSRSSAVDFDDEE